MVNDKYNYAELREAILTIVASEKVELVFLLGEFNNEEELKISINDTRDMVKWAIEYENNKTYERTLEDLNLFERILFGEMRDIPLNINGCFKDLAKWRLQHGR